jgi:hypothetical protein
LEGALATGNVNGDDCKCGDCGEDVFWSMIDVDASTGRKPDKMLKSHRSVTTPWKKGDGSMRRWMESPGFHTFQTTEEDEHIAHWKLSVC